MTITVDVRPEEPGLRPEPLVTTPLESAMHELRAEPYRMSDREFPGLRGDLRHRGGEDR